MGETNKQTKTGPRDAIWLRPKSKNLQSLQSDGRWKPSPDKFECGERSEYNNIVGGSITKLGEITFMALLGYEKLPGRNFYTCGGSIINKFYVLTAAHCITDDFR